MPLVTLTLDGPVATLTLTRPDKRNALSPALLDELHAAITEAAAAHPRVLVLRGEGKVFCAGGDIDDMRGRLGKPKETEETLRRGINAVVDELTAFPAPTLACVQGAAIGAGLGLALACDVTLVADDGKLGASHARLGLTPDGGTSWHLARALGPKLAMAMVLSADLLDGEVAFDMGLVTEAPPADELDARVAAWVEQLSTGPTRAYVNARKLVHAGLEISLGEALEREALSQAAMYDTADQQEGVKAFLEKRDARFQGK